jgi:hypothetical protein
MNRVAKDSICAPCQAQRCSEGQRLSRQLQEAYEPFRSGVLPYGQYHALWAGLRAHLNG